MIGRRRSTGVNPPRKRRGRVVIPAVSLGLASLIAVPTVLASDDTRLAAPKAMLRDEAQEDVGNLRAETIPTAASVTTAPPIATTVADSSLADLSTAQAPATTTTTLPGPPAGAGGWSAWATGATVDVYGAPGDLMPVTSFASPWRFGAPLVLLVTERRADGWAEVVLPQRPNGSTGWIKEEQVTIVTNEWRISVSLSDHRMVVVRGLEIVHDVSVSVGKASTPTPPGTYYVNAVVLTGRPQGAYGPAALALNGFSDVLTEFGGGDGQLAIHGTNKPSSIGRSESNGCVRVDNDVVAVLAEQIPLGTPVEITA
jgi:lipoprotein-anchoring transpeptidase ErfK/SrfK